ncbi:MAG: hypothetical protein AAF430_11825 [Myxococcota bacterium]
MPADPAAPNPARPVWLVPALAAGLAVLCVASLGAIRDHGFADLDDLGGIQLNPDLQVASLGEAIENAWTRSLISNWMPLTAHSHQFDHAWFGDDAGGHHTTSLVLHAASSLLLFFAMLALTNAPWRSAFVAAVFAVHPLHVETVAWISERKGVVSGLFFNATLLAYARYARVPSSGRYALVVAGVAGALLSKPTTVTLPCVLLLLDYWPLRRLDGAAVREKLPLFALVIAASIVTYFVQRDTGAMAFGAERGGFDRVATAIHAYGSYLFHTFWPANLAAFYPLPTEGRPSLFEWGSALLVLAALTLLGAALQRRVPAFWMGWLWFGGMLVPTLGLVQVGEQASADRYMYLPLIGLTVACTWPLADAAARWNRSTLLGAAGVAAVAALALTSVRQVDHWRDGIAMWNRVIAVSPDHPRAHIGLGSIQARTLALEAAEAHYEHAFSLDPDYARFAVRTYYETKASHLRKRDDPAGALASLQRAVEIDPAHARNQARLGAALLRAGDREAGLAAFTRSHALDPRQARVLDVLAKDAEAKRAFRPAIGYRRALLEIAPRSAGNRNNLAWLLATAPDPADRDPEQALTLARALVGDGGEAPAHQLDTLATALAAGGAFEEALVWSERAAQRARDAGNTAQAQEIEARADDFRAGRSFVEPDR